MRGAAVLLPAAEDPVGGIAAGQRGLYGPGRMAEHRPSERRRLDNVGRRSCAAKEKEQRTAGAFADPGFGGHGLFEILSFPVRRGADSAPGFELFYLPVGGVFDRRIPGESRDPEKSAESLAVRRLFSPAGPGPHFHLEGVRRAIADGPSVRPQFLRFRLSAAFVGLFQKAGDRRPFGENHRRAFAGG